MLQSKIRILSLFFVAVLLLGILASCGEDRYFKFSRDLEPLTDEQIEECNAAYRDEYFGSYEEYVSSKSENMREQAEKIYYGMKLIQNNVYTPYLGTFGGAIVVGTSLTSEEELYMIGDSTFEMGSLKKITVYKDGKLINISQAYNSGWLTDGDIAVISERIEKYESAKSK